MAANQLTTRHSNLRIWVEPLGLTTIATVAAEVNREGAVLAEAYRYRPGGWEGAVVQGTQVMGDFPLLVGEGYFLRFLGEGRWTLYGYEAMPPPTLSFRPSWNLVGFPYPSGVRAADLISLTDVLSPTRRYRLLEIDRWIYGGYEAAIAGYPFNNFALLPDRGYFVRAAEVVDYLPLWR